jgi:lipopolysaccharide assembly outer membrane protein LptD (OstA)
MKAVVFGSVAAFLLFNSCSGGICQENQQSYRPFLNYTESPRLYFLMPPTESTGRVELIAATAERNLSLPLNLSSSDTRTVLQLRGNVEVTMCSPGNLGCEHGAVVLHADSVDYNERTGEMDVRGNVHIGPFQNRPDGPSR